jgi:hypothetical protein
VRRFAGSCTSPTPAVKANGIRGSLFDRR